MKNTYKRLQKSVCSYLVKIRKRKNCLKVLLDFLKNQDPIKYFPNFLLKYKRQGFISKVKEAVPGLLLLLACSTYWEHILHVTLWRGHEARLHGFIMHLGLPVEDIKHQRNEGKTKI